MSAEDLMRVREELENMYKDIKVVSIKVEEEVQFLVGQFRDNYFSFGYTIKDENGELYESFFLQAIDSEYDDFAELSARIIAFLGFSPIMFCEEENRNFSWLWPTEQDVNDFERARLYPTYDRKDLN